MAESPGLMAEYSKWDKERQRHPAKAAAAAGEKQDEEPKAKEQEGGKADTTPGQAEGDGGGEGTALPAAEVRQPPEKVTNLCLAGIASIPESLPTYVLFPLSLLRPFLPCAAAALMPTCRAASVVGIKRTPPPPCTIILRV